jgi:hypothetical protein
MAHPRGVIGRGPGDDRGHAFADVRICSLGDIGKSGQFNLLRSQRTLVRKAGQCGGGNILAIRNNGVIARSIHTRLLILFSPSAALQPNGSNMGKASIPNGSPFRTVHSPFA